MASQGHIHRASYVRDKSINAVFAYLPFMDPMVIGERYNFSGDVNPCVEEWTDDLEMRYNVGPLEQATMWSAMIYLSEEIKKMQANRAMEREVLWLKEFEYGLRCRSRDMGFSFDFPTHQEEEVVEERPEDVYRRPVRDGKQRSNDEYRRPGRDYKEQPKDEYRRPGRDHKDRSKDDDYRRPERDGKQRSSDEYRRPGRGYKDEPKEEYRRPGRESGGGPPRHQYEYMRTKYQADKQVPEHKPGSQSEGRRRRSERPFCSSRGEQRRPERGNGGAPAPYQYEFFEIEEAD